MALVSAASLYPYLPGLSGGADAAVDALLGAVESQLAASVGWYPEATGGSVSWDSAARTFYLDGPDVLDPRLLQLPLAPVTVITSVYDDPTWGYTSSSYLVDSGDYVLDERKGEVWLRPDASWSWSTGKRNIQVVATAGFTSAPRRLELAILRQSAHAYQKQKGGAGRRRSTGKDVSSEYDLPPILDDVRAILRNFRLPSYWLS